jgi:hypothetical protein
VEKITVEQNKNKGYETIYDEEENLILYSSKKSSKENSLIEKHGFMEERDNKGQTQLEMDKSFPISCFGPISK